MSAYRFVAGTSTTYTYYDAVTGKWYNSTNVAPSEAALKLIEFNKIVDDIIQKVKEAERQHRSYISPAQRITTERDAEYWDSPDDTGHPPYT